MQTEHFIAGKDASLERSLTELLQGRALDALAGFPEPGFDLEEIAGAPNIEAPGMALKGCEMHHRLRAAYVTLQAQK